jgi:hypothetical protein
MTRPEELWQRKVEDLAFTKLPPTIHLKTLQEKIASEDKGWPPALVGGGQLDSRLAADLHYFCALKKGQDAGSTEHNWVRFSNVLCNEAGGGISFSQ